MQTDIHPQLINLSQVAEAESILRSCVHCGFCTAVCPTYLELGDELDSPRGRIYIIKEMLEQDRIEAPAQQHIDRCLTCRSCETACPSGVAYGRLLDISKLLIQDRYGHAQTRWQKLLTKSLLLLVPEPRLFGPLYALGRWFRPVLPRFLRKQLLPVELLVEADTAVAPLASNGNRKVLLLDGCVQKVATPGVNQAIERLLAEQGISVVRMAREGCCGALDYHLGEHKKAADRVKHNVAEAVPMLDEVEAILSSASGCGVAWKDYATMLPNDATGPLRDDAERVAAKVLDVAEFLGTLPLRCAPVRIVVHTPCTLQHGQQLPGIISELLERAGARVVAVDEAQLCCGSAGTYSILQPELSVRLGERKAHCLERDDPEVIVTANIGCQTQLSAYVRKGIPVMHWVTFLNLYAVREQAVAD